MTQSSISEWFKSLQDSICSGIEETDGKGKFQEDLWERPEGGGGRTRIIRNGAVIEKGGVNFSAVHGKMPEKILEALQLRGSDFFATGVSIVMHPESPMVPVIHMNVRYFEIDTGVKWFGGGIDLTPHYINKEDAGIFHQKLKAVCDHHHPEYYNAFKKWADDYFFLKHRNETRGVGGIFFDRLSEEDGITLEQRFEFVKEVGNAFVPLYAEQIRKNREKPFGDREKQWQMLRRSRYVEFNLLYDKGTRFGLDTNGRTESILMSMPPQANWEYNFTPEKGSPEEASLSLLKKNINWINL